MSSSIQIQTNVPFEMRDGTLLRADIYKPEEVGKYPAILVRTPYNKEAFNQGLFNPLAFARAGYAVVVQDIRGRYASDGLWERHRMFEVEALDGYDTVELIAVQRWCNGKVGLAGGSYLSALQWITAMANPPHLRAFAPYIGDIGTNIAPSPETGAVSFYSAANALPLTAADLVDKLEQQGTDVTELRQHLNHALQDPYWVINYLPFKDIPLAQFEPIRLMLDQRLHPPTKEEIVQRKRYDLIKIPGLHIGGWFDQLEEAIFNNCLKVKELGGSELAKTSQHLMVGPWDHGNLRSFLGNMEFGPASANESQLINHIIQFFDKYLLDKEEHIPAVRHFVMGRNEWRTAESWPLPNTAWQSWYFHSSGRASSNLGDGTLSRMAPLSEQADTYSYNPLQPVPTVGGKLLAMGGMVPGPVDQSIIERRNDVLCYTTNELEDDLEITGPLKIILYASTSAKDTDFTAIMTDVQPNGLSLLIAQGIQRAAYRYWNHEAAPIEPGAVVTYTINLGNTSHVFRKGHRIRVQISSSNFPLYDRNMNTGNVIGEDAIGVIAQQTIYHDSNYASYIELPVIT
jgi:putative CocE/NonD family hydrolase